MYEYRSILVCFTMYVLQYRYVVFVLAQCTLQEHCFTFNTFGV